MATKKVVGSKCEIHHCCRYARELVCSSLLVCCFLLSWLYFFQVEHSPPKWIHLVCLFVCLLACLAATFFLDLSHPSPAHPAGPLAIRVILWHLVPARRTLVGTIDSANQKKTPARCIWGKINTKFMKHLICEKNLLIPGHHYLLDWNPVVIFTIMRVCDCSFQGV